MTYRLVLFVDGRRTALLAGLIQLTTLQFIYLHSARTGELEPALTFLLTLTAYLFIRAIESGRSFIGHHVSLFALMSLKLPLVVVPVLAELAFFVLHRPARARFPRWVATGCVMLPFALSWHIAQAIALWDPFLNVVRNMTRVVTRTTFVGESTDALARAGFYARVLAFGAFPYVIVYPVALFEILRHRGNPAQRPRWQALGLYALAIAVFFVSLGQHYAWYIIPVYPFLSIFAGAWLSELPRRGRHALLFVCAGLTAAVLLFADLDSMTFNPFAERASHIPMRLGWRRLLGIGPALGIPLLTAGLTLGLFWLRSRIGARVSRIAAASLAAALIGSAVLRVVFPLAHLDHQSPAARIRERLDAARAMDPPAAFPVTIRTPYRWDLAYYLWDDYEWTSIRTPEGPALRVFPRIESGGRER
jgi:hypothetical protein